MNKLTMLYISSISFLCTSIGIKFLSVLRVKNFDQIEDNVTSTFNILTSGTTYSFLIIGAIFITIFGLIFSIKVVVTSFNSLNKVDPIVKTLI